MAGNFGLSEVNFVQKPRSLEARGFPTIPIIKTKLLLTVSHSF